MDISIHYPYGIPFYSNMKFISVFFSNNSRDFYTIYFVKNEKVTDLAGIVFPNQKNKKYHFPEKSIIATTEIENEVKDDTVKTIQTMKGTGKVESIIKEDEIKKDDDAITLDNFMDDMTNMLKDKDVEVKNEKGEYKLFDDANDI